jgi:uncharacterized repeat protein (TIGR01451 family)
MTTRSLFVFALACALVLAGLATQNGSVVALAIPLLVYFGLGQLAKPEALQFTITRKLSASKIAPGKPITVTVTLTNTGSPIDEVVFVDGVPAGLDVIEGETRVLTALAAGQQVTLSYVVRGMRGDYRFGPLGIWANDAFALSQREMRVSAAAQLLILPETSKINPIRIRPNRTHGFTGSIPTRQAGTGSDILAVRMYQPGDRLRQINWRVSARRPDRMLHTNTLEQQRIADVGLILDAREARDVHIAGESLFEQAVQATGSLSDEFLRIGHRVGLLVYGSGGLTLVYPGYGRLQRQRILHVLGRATPGQHLFYESLKEIPTRFFPAQSQLVYIGRVDPDDVSSLLALRARGYALIVVSPDALRFEVAGLKANAPSSPSFELATRIAMAERTIGLRQLRQHGVQVVDWDVRQPLGSTLTSMLVHVPTRQRGVLP